jgi:YHS domain-containing protein
VVFGFFRFIFYAVIGYLIYKFVMYVLAPQPGKRTPDRAESLSGVMVKDEVCNTYLPREDAVKETIEGVDYYFCSPACRGKFLARRKG